MSLTVTPFEWFERFEIGGEGRVNVMDFTLTVPASRGRMGEAEFYSAVFPLGAVVKLFAYDPEKMSGLSPEERTQRALKASRIPEISSYILDHPEDWVFSSITISVEDIDRVEFQPGVLSEDIGLLTLPMDIEFTVNDGQHRVAGIAEALVHNEDLAKQNVPVLIFPGADRGRSQQIFSDLNRTVQKTSRSLDILFDHRSPINRITVGLADTVPLFRGRVDKERIALAGRSKEFTTLANLQAATTALLLNGKLDGKLSSKEMKQRLDLATRYWNVLTGIVEPWSQIADGQLEPAEARKTYVSVYSLVLYALGSVGGLLLKRYPDTWEDEAKALGKIDWRKSNPEWQGICMVGHEVVTRGPARKATADLLAWKLDLGPRPRTVLSTPEAPAGTMRRTRR